MIDRDTEKRIWKRVLGHAAQDTDLVRLIRLCLLQTEEFRRLDPEWYRQEKRTLGLLTGLYFLEEGREFSAENHTLPAGSRSERIRRSRDRCQEMLMLCIRLENHPRYGAVFTDLTRHRRAVCARLTQTAPIK